MKQCKTCSMPLEKPEDFAGGDTNADVCLYCVNEDGSIRSCEEIFEGGVQFFIGATKSTRELAEKLVRKNMKSLSYWKENPSKCLEGEEATEEEFANAMSKMAEDE